MTVIDEVDEIIEQFHLSLDEFVKGNPGPAENFFSHRDDVTLANPYGPPVRGWEQVAQSSKHAASTSRDGKMLAFESIAKVVTPELAYVVEIERGKAKIGRSKDITPFALRVTMILRPENGVWKIVHRHADAITTAQPAESILPK